MVSDDLHNAFRYHRQQAPRIRRAETALKLAREDVAAGRRRYPNTGKPSFGVWESSVPGFPGRYSAGLSYTDRAFYMDSFPDGWRNLGNVGEIRTESTYRGRYVEHTGWFTTDDGFGDTVFGVVLQLPARNGECQYFPGVQWSGQDGVTAYPLDRYDNIGDAARAADQIAEKLAEEERDYQRAWRAGVNAAEHDANAKNLRKQIVTIISDLRVARRAIDPSIDGGTDEDNALLRLCDCVRNKVSDLLDEMREERAARDKLRDEVPNSLSDAFKEGFAQ